MLGRKLQVPLDAIIKASRDASPPEADYARAVQKRSTTEYDSARQHLNKVAICYCMRVPPSNYRKLSKVTTMVTFGISNLETRYFQEVAPFRKQKTVHKNVMTELFVGKKYRNL